jgi:hypothetical protein
MQAKVDPNKGRQIYFFLLEDHLFTESEWSNAPCGAPSMPWQSSGFARVNFGRPIYLFCP